MWMGGGRPGEGQGWDSASRYRLQGAKTPALTSSPHLSHQDIVGRPLSLGLSTVASRAHDCPSF